MTLIRQKLNAYNDARRAEYAAKSASQQAERDYQDAVRREHGEVEFSDTACLHAGSLSHVYDHAEKPSGIGKRVCIFCGSDDFDLY